MFTDGTIQSVTNWIVEKKISIYFEFGKQEIYSSF